MEQIVENFFYILLQNIMNVSIEIVANGHEKFVKETSDFIY
jgi:hypothetical protein